MAFRYRKNVYLSDPRVDDLITVHNNKSPYVFRVTQKEVPSVSSMPNLGVFKWLFDMLYAYKHCKIAGYLWRKGVKFVPLTFLLQAVKTWETRGVKKCYYDFFHPLLWKFFSVSSQFKISIVFVIFNYNGKNHSFKLFLSNPCFRPWRESLQ